MISLELIFLLFCVLIVSIISRRNIIFPSNIIILSFLVAAVCNAIIMDVLDSDITNKTLGITLIFVAVFYLSSYISSFASKTLFLKNYDNDQENRREKELTHINVKYWKIITLLILQIFAIVIFAYEFHKNIGSFTADNLSIYRGYSLSEQSIFPAWVTILGNISEVVSYVSIYIFINNILSGNKDRERNFILFLSSIASLPIPIMSASRFADVSIILFAVVLYIHFEYYRNGKLRKSILITPIVLLLVFYIFQFLGSVIGRGKYNPLSFVYYYGGGLSLFDTYIRNPFILESNAPGYQTFANLYNLLKKLGAVSFSYNRYYPYGYVNGKGIGNVYSCLIAYFYDFGYPGIVILSSIFGSIFGFLFEKIRAVKLNGIRVSVIFYFYLTYTLVFSPYSENIVWNLLSAGLYENFILIYLVSKFLDTK